MKKNVDSNGNLFAVKIAAEHKQIYKATVMLEGIPSEFHRVFIEGYTENVPPRNDLPEGTFNVDYNNGKIYFNPAEEGKFIVADYYSLGTELIKAERVVTTYLEGENFCLSFAEEIRQNQELRDALLKELEENPKIRIVESSEWVHEVKSELEQSFLIDDTIFNPVTDLLTVFYNGDFLHANKYTRIGCRIILKDWQAVEGDVFSFIIYKHVVGTVEIGGDGSLMIDGSIGRHKLSEDVQQDIALIPLHNEHIARLEEELNALGQDLEETKSNLNALAETVTEQGEKINEIETNLEEVKELAENTAQEVDEAKGDFDSLKDKISNVEEKALDQDIVIGTEKYRKLVSLDEDGEVNAHIDIEGASFKELTVSKLNCDGVVNVGSKKATTINIVEGDNIQQIINEIPKYLLGEITINISGVHYADINFYGFMGSSIFVNLADDCEIHGSLYVFGSTTYIEIKSDSCKGKIIHDSSRESAIRVRTSPYVSINSVTIEAGSTSSKNAVYSSFGSGVRVGDSKINGFSQYVGYVNQCSRLYMINNTGNDNTGNAYYAHGGGTVFLQGTRPASAQDGSVSSSGQVVGTATASGTLTGSAPSVEATKVKTYGCASMKSYRSVDGWKTNNRVYMGKYNSSNPSSYNYYGLYVLGNDTINAMKSDLTGKKIKSVKLTIKRNVEGGLDTTGVSINIYGTTNAGSGTSFPLTKTYKTNIGKIKKGSEYTVTMPNSLVSDIINGTIKSLMLYRADQTNYSIFADVFELEVTYA